MHWKPLFAKVTAAPIVEAGTRAFFFSDRFECRNCRIVYTRPDPRRLSFNNPYGACPRCQGFGNVMDLDENKIIPDPSLSLDEFPIAAWNNSEYGGCIITQPKSMICRNMFRFSK